MKVTTEVRQEGADWNDFDNSPPPSGVYDIMIVDGINIFPKDDNSKALMIPGVIFKAHEAENQEEINKRYTTFIPYVKSDSKRHTWGEKRFQDFLTYSGLAKEFNKRFAAYETPFDVPEDELCKWLQLNATNKKARYTLETKPDKNNVIRANIVHIETCNSAIETGADDDLV